MPVLTLPQADSMSVRAKALVFEDERSRALLARIQQVAPSDATTLLCGETGTGKEIVARHVHALSGRRNRPFLALNCGALAESLIESELFGHERGAFTGALSAKAGWFEAADGGTLFLDEIGDLPLAAQVKLLRVLQEGEVVRLGARQPVRIDVRLIAATNVALEAAVAAGRFREDLYYRLNVAPLELLPLRERPDDVLPLARYFLDQYARKLSVADARFSPEAASALLEHVWPGNIRELENAVHRALIVSKRGCIEPGDLSLVRRASIAPRAALTRDEAQPGSLERELIALFEQNLPNLNEHLEERVMRAAFEYCNRNQVHTARLLGISRNIVRARLIQFRAIAGTVRPARPEPKPAPAVSALRAVRPSRELLHIGYQRYGLLPVLKATGALERALEPLRVQVEWRELAGGMQLFDALRAGELELGMVGETPPVLAQAERVPFVYLGAEAPAPRREAIVVQQRSPIRTVRDLTGCTVMLNHGSNAHYFLILALQEARLEYSDIRVVHEAPDHALKLFESGLIDAWATWDPFVEAARRRAGARVLRDADGLTDNTAYYVAARTLVDERPELVQVFLREINAAARWARESGNAALELVASQLGSLGPFTPDIYAHNTGVRLIDATHVASQQEIANTFLRLRLIERPVRVAEAQRFPRPVDLQAAH